MGWRGPCLCACLGAVAAWLGCVRRSAWFPSYGDCAVRALDWGLSCAPRAWGAWRGPWSVRARHGSRSGGSLVRSCLAGLHGRVGWLPRVALLCASARAGGCLPSAWCAHGLLSVHAMEGIRHDQRGLFGCFWECVAIQCGVPQWLCRRRIPHSVFPF